MYSCIHPRNNVGFVHMADWVYNENFIEIREQNAHALDGKIVDEIGRVERGEELLARIKYGNVQLKSVTRYIL